MAIRLTSERMKGLAYALLGEAAKGGEALAPDAPVLGVPGRGDRLEWPPTTLRCSFRRVELAYALGVRPALLQAHLAQPGPTLGLAFAVPGVVARDYGARAVTIMFCDA